MIKIKVSYEHQEELQRLLERLGKDIVKIKAPGQQKGRFRKIYIELKNR